jgi:hypothetical protein
MAEGRRRLGLGHRRDIEQGHRPGEGERDRVWRLRLCRCDFPSKSGADETASFGRPTLRRSKVGAKDRAEIRPSTPKRLHAAALAKGPLGLM